MKSVKLQKALAIEGFMTEDELTWLASHAQKAKVIIEIGCWMGRSTRALADNTKGTIFAVDHWQGAKGYYTQLAVAKRGGSKGLFKTFRHNVAPHIADGRIIPVQSDSKDAIPLLKKLFKEHGIKRGADMIFVDGDHSYSACKRDVNLFMELLSKDGLLCGHDIDQHGVIRAVNELFGDKFKQMKGKGNRIWWATHTSK